MRSLGDPSSQNRYVLVGDYSDRGNYNLEGLLLPCLRFLAHDAKDSRLDTSKHTITCAVFSQCFDMWSSWLKMDCPAQSKRYNSTATFVSGIFTILTQKSTPDVY